MINNDVFWEKVDRLTESAEMFNPSSVESDDGKPFILSTQSEDDKSLDYTERMWAKQSQIDRFKHTKKQRIWNNKTSKISEQVVARYLSEELGMDARLPRDCFVVYDNPNQVNHSDIIIGRWTANVKIVSKQVDFALVLIASQLSMSKSRFFIAVKQCAHNRYRILGFATIDDVDKKKWEDNPYGWKPEREKKDRFVKIIGEDEFRLISELPSCMQNTDPIVINNPKHSPKITRPAPKPKLSPKPVPLTYPEKACLAHSKEFGLDEKGGNFIGAGWWNEKIT